MRCRRCGFAATISSSFTCWIRPELEFGFGDAQPFEDLESGEQMPVVPEAFRAEYRSLVQAHVDALQKSFSGVRVDYMLLDTSKPLDHALFKYLNSRSRTMKIR